MVTAVIAMREDPSEVNLAALMDAAGREGTHQDVASVLELARAHMAVQKARFHGEEDAADFLDPATAARMSGKLHHADDRSHSYVPMKVQHNWWEDALMDLGCLGGRCKGPEVPFVEWSFIATDRGAYAFWLAGALTARETAHPLDVALNVVVSQAVREAGSKTAPCGRSGPVVFRGSATLQDGNWAIGGLGAHAVQRGHRFR